MADFNMKDSDPPVSVTVLLVDAQGNPTVPDIAVGQPGGPTWAEDSSGTVVSQAVSVDGMTATYTPVATGTANIVFSVSDNDGTKITASGTIEVDPGEAIKATMTFTAGVPVPPVVSPTP